MRISLALITLLGSLVMGLGIVIPVAAAPLTCDDLQHQIDRQSERIDHLEEELHVLQSQVHGQGEMSQVPLSDPLVGEWQCTNNVFTYNMTFFADGVLLQGSPTFGPMHKLSWQRLKADEILLSGGVKIQVNMSGEDAMMAENLQNLAKWECRKLQN